MDTRAAQLYQLLSGLRILVRMQGSGHDHLVDGLDLTISLHSIRRFLASGETVELDEGLQRLGQIIGRRDRQAMENGRHEISFLEGLAKSMSESERHAALSLIEGGLFSPEWVSKHTLPEKVDLLVVAASLEPELRCFVDQLNECKEVVSSDNSEMHGLTYFEGVLQNREMVGGRPIRVVASVQAQPGVTDCAALVVNGLRLFRPRVLALTGVCVGQQKMGVRSMDVVVPSAVFTYDAGKHTEKGFEQEARWCEVDPKIIRRVKSQGPAILSSVTERINSVVPGRQSTPQIHTGVMACGATAVNREDWVAKIAGANRKIVGLDLESYALLRAARLTNEGIRALVVKGAIDFAAEKNGNLREQAAFWAAAFLAQFLMAEFDALCPNEGA